MPDAFKHRNEPHLNQDLSQPDGFPARRHMDLSCVESPEKEISEISQLTSKFLGATIFPRSHMINLNLARIPFGIDM